MRLKLVAVNKKPIYCKSLTLSEWAARVSEIAGLKQVLHRHTPGRGFFVALEGPISAISDEAKKQLSELETNLKSYMPDGKTEWTSAEYREN